MKISENVLNILEGCPITQNGSQTELVITQKLDRKDYVEVNKVLECLGGKWNKKAKAHVFEGDVREAIDRVMIAGDVVDAKKEFQFFETPEDLAREMVQQADIRTGMRVLEPSAGAGRIAEEIRSLTGISPDCVELWSKNQQVLLVKGFVLKENDFLAYKPVELYDRIVANPPFTRQQDVDHVLHMYECLKPGGKLVTLMSPSWTFRNNKKSVEFRAFLDREGAEWKEVPAGTFSASGTEIRTILLELDK